MSNMVYKSATVSIAGTDFSAGGTLKANNITITKTIRKVRITPTVRAIPYKA